MRKNCAILAAVATLAGWEPAAASTLPDSGELFCERAALGACNYVDPGSGLMFLWPNDWPTGRLKLVIETGPAARARQLGALRWIGVEYLPDDPSQPEATLFHVAVLRRSEWLMQSARPGPVNGVEVATGWDQVVVATRSSANPYPPGSLDADIFDALMPTLAEISRIVQLSMQR